MAQIRVFLRLTRNEKWCTNFNKRWYCSNNNNNNNNNVNTRYTKDHSWISIDNSCSGDIINGKIGITKNCIDEYDDVLYVKFPIINQDTDGNEINNHFKIQIETMSDQISLNSPIPGKIISINQEVLDFPNNVNKYPTTSGWLCTLNFNNISNFNKLMNKFEYDNYCKKK